MGKRCYSIESVLNGLCFDLQRMIREKQSKKVIINLLQSKLDLLENKSKWQGIVMWDDKPTLRMRSEKILTNIKEIDIDEKFEEDIYIG